MKKEFLKKLFLSAGILVILVSSSSVPALATVKTASSSAAPKTQEERMANLKTRAENEIGRRVTALNGLISRINQMKHLKASDKSSFINSIETEIKSLNSLKTEIDSDTDVTVLKTDVQSIVTSYRVFLLFIPQVQLLAAADRVTDIAGKLNDLATKLQTRITTAKAAGKDVTSMETTLGDMTAKISEANTEYNNVEASVIPLTPNDFPANKPTLIAARKMIQTAHQDLVSALQDAKIIIQALKALSSTSSAPQQ